MASIASPPVTSAVPLNVTVIGIPQTVAFYSTSSDTPPAITTATTTYAPSGPFQLYALGSAVAPNSTITYTSSTPSYCTVNSSSGLVTIVGAGACTITADAAATAHYADSGTTSLALTINRANQAALTVTSTSGTYLTPLTLTDSGGSGTGADTYGVANGTATGCTVNGTAPGPYTLTSTSAGTSPSPRPRPRTRTTSQSLRPRPRSPSPRPTKRPSTVTSHLGHLQHAAHARDLRRLRHRGGHLRRCERHGDGLCPSRLRSWPLHVDVDVGRLLHRHRHEGRRRQLQRRLLGPDDGEHRQGQPGDTYDHVNFGSLQHGLDLDDLGRLGHRAVTYAVVNGTASACTVNGTAPGPYTLTSATGGTCLVTASKALDGNYNATTSAQTTVTFTAINQAALTVTSTSGTLTATNSTFDGGTDGGAVTYGVANGSATGCTVNGTGPYTLTSTSAGTLTITATMAGNISYNPVSVSDHGHPRPRTKRPSPSRPPWAPTTRRSRSRPPEAPAPGRSPTALRTARRRVVPSTAPVLTRSRRRRSAPAPSPPRRPPTATTTPSPGPTTVNIAKANQATLTITSTSGPYNTALTLTTSGGSGTGAVTYAVVNGTASACTVNGTAPGPYTLTSATGVHLLS